ncbi:M23 family metallopeptidase [Salipiger mucosus]|uniref:Peptidase, M23/M37 family protein n=1 Tax=Salipiger mucosus DSM 16094 TaxID=1123237 RepID=S9S9B2_9RHOB|nr:M23 family metallopeptidase [Salipiger mucosus]EPX86750.1 peptidase, M23/M37 family protein [Salipiger mucosus DSM 16094]
MRALIAALIVSAAPLAAETPVLTLPIDCELGVSCFIEDYVDRDPEPGTQRDFACGLNSRDGHKGTDIALLSFDRMDEGVEVRAAAPGRVLRTRDGMADDITLQGVTDDNACGNAALIEHGDGWQTMYCHMKRGSVAVQPGDEVAAGDPLGEVGVSGQTTHPHVHLTVYRDGEVVDPFAPGDTSACDPAPDDTLWAEPPTYYKTGLMTAGFSTALPSLDEVRSGAARVTETAPGTPLVVYGHMAYPQPGDLLTITAQGPDGEEMFRQEIEVETDQVSQMRAFGRRAPSGGWPAGDYLGEALVTRDGVVIAHRNAHVTVR